VARSPTLLTTALASLNLRGLGGQSAARLTGGIPPGLAALTALEDLNLSHGNLTGPIPTALFARLTALTSLSLDHNQLSGTIPATLTALTAVTYFSLYCNRLSGTIPPGLTALTAVTLLGLDSNRLSGAVPPLPFGRYSVFCCLQSSAPQPACDDPRPGTNRFACPLPPGAASKCVGQGPRGGYPCSTTCGGARAELKSERRTNRI
jgi:hypothetical protein